MASKRNSTNGKYIFYIYNNVEEITLLLGELDAPHELVSVNGAITFHINICCHGFTTFLLDFIRFLLDSSIKDLMTR